MRSFLPGKQGFSPEDYKFAGGLGRGKRISVLIFRWRVAKMIFLQRAEVVELADTPS
jgi:hypothetical protein